MYVCIVHDITQQNIALHMHYITLQYSNYITLQYIHTHIYMYITYYVPMISYGLVSFRVDMNGRCCPAAVVAQVQPQGLRRSLGAALAAVPQRSFEDAPGRVVV